MLRTIIWYFLFWVYLTASIVFFIPLVVLGICKQKTLREKYVFSLSSSWGRIVVRIAGGRVTVSGLENIPACDNICFISNHQGGFDIPLIIGYVPKTIGFIAKKELLYIPILSTWMKAIHCIFINRANRRDSVKVIQQGVEQIKNGHPMVIFPEGTRSRKSEMERFKSGSLKLAVRSKALIVPITIDGSYKMKEERGGLITPAHVSMTIHPSIDSAALQDEDTKNLAARLWTIINSALPKNGA